MSDRIDTTQYECAYNSDLYYKIRMWMRGDNEPDEIAIGIMSLYSDPIAELKRCYEELDRKNKWLEELDRCPTCGKEGVWFTADPDAEFDDECRRCGRDNNASE